MVDDRPVSDDSRIWSIEPHDDPPLHASSIRTPTDRYHIALGDSSNSNESRGPALLALVSPSTRARASHHCTHSTHSLLALDGLRTRRERIVSCLRMKSGWRIKWRRPPAHPSATQSFLVSVVHGDSNCLQPVGATASIYRPSSHCLRQQRTAANGRAFDIRRSRTIRKQPDFSLE